MLNRAGGLAEPVAIVRLSDPRSQRAAVVAQEDIWLLVDDLDRPVVLLVRQPPRHDTSQVSCRWTIPMRIPRETAVSELVRRALERPATSRFDPVACCDDKGRLIGIVRVEQAVLAALDAPAHSLTA